MLQTNAINSAEKPIKVDVLRPFYVSAVNGVRLAKEGETVELPIWLAKSLAGHTPPKVGPAGSFQKPKAEKAAA